MCTICVFMDRISFSPISVYSIHTYIYIVCHSIRIYTYIYIIHVWNFNLTLRTSSYIQFPVSIFNIMFGCLFTHFEYHISRKKGARYLTVDGPVVSMMIWNCARLSQSMNSIKYQDINLYICYMIPASNEV